MAFSLRSFILTGLCDAVGKLADYQVILNAAAWQEKGVLSESELELLNNMITARTEPGGSAEGAGAEDASAEDTGGQAAPNDACDDAGSGIGAAEWDAGE